MSRAQADIWIITHPPDHELGYTEPYLSSLLNKDEWPHFQEFMNGQTVSMITNELGENVLVIYVDDVYRYIARLPVID